jgi:hypothetical protein
VFGLVSVSGIPDERFWQRFIVLLRARDRYALHPFLGLLSLNLTLCDASEVITVKM